MCRGERKLMDTYELTLVVRSPQSLENTSRDLEGTLYTHLVEYMPLHEDLNLKCCKEKN